MYVKDPAIRMALETLNAMSNAASSASGAFANALPQATNPFYAFNETLRMHLSAIHNVAQQTEYDFGGAQHERLMERFRNESLFHNTYPDQFPKPPEIDWPPVYSGNYVSAEFIRNWLRANADVMPESFTIELTAYREKFHQLDRSGGETILRLYGEEIVAISPTGRAMITEEQFIDGINKVALGPVINPKEVVGDNLIVEGISAATTAARALLKTLREIDNDKPYTDENEEKMRRLQRDLVDFINSFDRSFNHPRSVTDLRVSWRKFYYRLAAIDSQLTTLWDPLVVEAVPIEEEKKDEV